MSGKKRSKTRQTRAEYEAGQARRREMILEAHEVKGMTWREIGNMLGIERSTARQLATRARKDREEALARLQPPLFEIAV